MVATHKTLPSWVDWWGRHWPDSGCGQPQDEGGCPNTNCATNAIDAATAAVEARNDTQEESHG